MNINCILIHEFIILIINKRILKIELTTRQNLIHESRHSVSYSFSSVYFSFPFTIPILSLILFPFTNATILHLNRKVLHTNEESPLVEEHAFPKWRTGQRQHTMTLSNSIYSAIYHHNAFFSDLYQEKNHNFCHLTIVSSQSTIMIQRDAWETYSKI